MHWTRHWFDLVTRPERRPRGSRAGQEMSRRRPAQLLALGLATGIALGTVLLILPIAGTEHSPTALQAFFTATSAVCVTGLIVVDTATHWTAFGQVVILVLIQIGGLGAMTFASVLGLMIARHLGLQTKMMAATATRSVRLGEVRTVLLGALRITVVLEVLTTLILALPLVAELRRPDRQSPLARSVPRGLRVQQRGFLALRHRRGALRHGAGGRVAVRAVPR